MEKLNQYFSNTYSIMNNMYINPFLEEDIGGVILGSMVSNCSEDGFQKVDQIKDGVHDSNEDDSSSEDSFKVVNNTDLLNSEDTLKDALWERLIFDLLQVPKTKEEYSKLKKKHRSQLLKSIVTNQIPVHLRSHAYIALTGFTTGYQSKKELAQEELDLMVAGISKEMYSQINKDIDRTWFPQSIQLGYQIDRSANLDSLSTDLEVEVIDLHSLLRRSLILFFDLNKEVKYVQGMNSVFACIIYNVRESSKQSNKLSNEGESVLPVLYYNEHDIVQIYSNIINENEGYRVLNQDFSFFEEVFEDFEESLKKEEPQIYQKMLDTEVRN